MHENLQKDLAELNNQSLCKQMLAELEADKDSNENSHDSKNNARIIRH